MGARDCTRASPEWLRRALAAVELQWGRAIVRAQAEPALIACDRATTCFNGGARLYARKRDRDRRAEHRRGASMGARDCTRASTWKTRETTTLDRLQWGRAIVRAQAKIWSVVLRSVNQLQWGRAIVRAQARDEVGVLHLALVASMGARDCTRASG